MPPAYTIASSRQPTNFLDFKILEEPHPPANDTDVLHKHWPSLAKLLTKKAKKQRIAHEISVEVDRLASPWRPHGIPDDPHFQQGQTVIGPEIGVGENDFRFIGAYHYRCERCDSRICSRRYHPWTRSLSEEQMLLNDTLTPLLLMREELRPKHRLAHKEHEENKRITIRHSRLYIAAAQKYYSSEFRDSSWFRKAVQHYAMQQVPAPEATTHQHISENTTNVRKRKRLTSEESLSLPSTQQRTQTSLSVVHAPERLMTSPLPPFDPLGYNGFMSDDDMEFKPILTRTRGNHCITPRQPAAGSSEIPQEIIELTDSESVDQIDWDDQVPFTIIFWTSSERSYEDILLHYDTDDKANLLSFKTRLSSRGIDLTRSLETYNPLSAMWVCISPYDTLGPFTISNKKPRVFLLRYEGVELLRGFQMLRKVASEIPISQKELKGKGKVLSNI